MGDECLYGEEHEVARCGQSWCPDCGSGADDMVRKLQVEVERLKSIIIEPQEAVQDLFKLLKENQRLRAGIEAYRRSTDCTDGGCFFPGCTACAWEQEIKKREARDGR